MLKGLFNALTMTKGGGPEAAARGTQCADHPPGDSPVWLALLGRYVCRSSAQTVSLLMGRWTAISRDEDCEVTMSGKAGADQGDGSRFFLFSLILSFEEDSALPRKAENRVLGTDIESPLPAPESQTASEQSEFACSL